MPTDPLQQPGSARAAAPSDPHLASPFRSRPRRRVAGAAAAISCLALLALATAPGLADRLRPTPPQLAAPPATPTARQATPDPAPTSRATATPAGCGVLAEGPVLSALRQYLRGAGALELGPVATAPVLGPDGAAYLAARIDGPGDEQRVAMWLIRSLDELPPDPGPGASTVQDVLRLREVHAYEVPRFTALWSVGGAAEELSYWRSAGDQSNPYPSSPAARRRAVRCLGPRPTPSPPSPVAGGDWEPVDGLQLSTGGIVSLLSTGTGVLVISGGGHPLEPQVGSRYDPATGATAPLGPGLRQWVGGSPLAWTGTEAIGGSLDGLQAYDPSTDQLRTLPPAPALTDLTPFPPYDVVQWTGSELLVWSPEQGSAGVALDPATESWRLLAPFPLSSRSWPAASLTGRQLVVWGGCDATPQCDDFQTGADELRDGAAYDVVADAWTPLPDGPLAARDRPHAVWTGQEVVFWGGNVPEGTTGDYAAAYDPATRTWRTVPAGPLPPRSYEAMVWSGDRLLVCGGGIGGDLLRRDGAAYDPQNDRWTTLPDAPVAGNVGDSVVWTGRGMLVVAADDRGRDAAVYRP